MSQALRITTRQEHVRVTEPHEAIHHTCAGRAFLVGKTGAENRNLQVIAPVVLADQVNRRSVWSELPRLENPPGAMQAGAGDDFQGNLDVAKDKALRVGLVENVGMKRWGFFLRKVWAPETSLQGVRCLLGTDFRNIDFPTCHARKFSR